jgi:hypothetical protein
MRAKMLSLGYTSEEELTGGFFNGVGSFPQYNEPNFNNNAYNVPPNPYDSNNFNNNFNNNGFSNNFNNGGKVDLSKPTDPPQNPNDVYNGVMPGIDDVPNPYNTDNPDSQNNDSSNPYNS